MIGAHSRHDPEYPSAQPMQKELAQWISETHTAQVGLAAYDFSTGEEILVDPDITFHPASTIKICVMMEVFHQARQGSFSLDDRMTVRSEFASIVDGSAYHLSIADDSEKELYDLIGRPLPVRDLLRRMITASSNLATNLLVERLTPGRISAFMRDLGADGLIVRRGVEDNKAFQLGLNNEATARGFMNLLVKLARREVVSPDDSDEMIGILLGQQFNEMIPAQLPAGVRVAHKTGWTGRFFHDIGIIYPPNAKPLVLAILTNGFEKEEDAHPFVASLAKKVYEHWTK